MAKARMSQPEFSRIFEIETLGGRPGHRQIEASAEERATLARRFGLENLDHLSASLTVEPVSRTLVRLRGDFTAEVTQSCVVTLEPVRATVVDTVTVVYAAEEGRAGRDAAVDLTLDDEDWPEPLVDGRIDLGEAVAQQLAVALDPYPRAPGAALAAAGGAGAEGGDGAGAGPFGRLTDLMKGGRQR